MLAAGHGGGYPSPRRVPFELELVNEVVETLGRIDRVARSWIT